MPPKRFEGKFGIPASHTIDSQLTSALYRLPESVNVQSIKSLANDITEKVNKGLQEKYDQHLDGGSLINEIKLQRSLSEEHEQILFLKLVRYFESGEDLRTIDVATCVDALLESPRFLASDKGSMEKLFEIHQVKTLQKIAELRKKRSEMTDSHDSNPYENLVETDNGKFYLARLLNMPHLEEESEYMDHCVGTSTSYISKIKNGEVEIFSFRDKETDKPLVTIEYDTHSHELLQVKGVSDRIPKLSDSFSLDLLNALEKLSTSINDQGEMRTVRTHVIADMKQLLKLKEKVERKDPYTRDELIFLYEVKRPIECFDSERDPLIAELISDRNREEDIEILCDCEPQYIAHDFTDIDEHTLVFCEDTGTKITFFDFREEKNKKKIPKLLELAQKIKATGSPARPDMSFEGGIISIDIPHEKVQDLPTALQSYKEADNGTPSYIWGEWKNEKETPITSPNFETVILSYNNDPKIQESSDKIVEDMDRLGLRPATLEEMIALGIAKPEHNKRNGTYLVGLTPYSLGGGSCVPFLFRNGGRRRLDGNGWGDWNSLNRFVCVRK